MLGYVGWDGIRMGKHVGLVIFLCGCEGMWVEVAAVAPNDYLRFFLEMTGEKNGGHPSS